MSCTAREPAYNLAAATLEDVGDIRITGRHLRNLAAQVGGELEREQDAKTDAYFNQPLPKVPTAPTTAIQLACVSVDGGRMQTRLDGGPNGVQQPHWRETKNALFMRMTGVQFDADPQPTLPECFQDRKYMKKLLSGISDESNSNSSTRKSSLRKWRPKKLFRTCLSSLRDSNSFGRMMEAEADSRGFFEAQKRAFVGDGLLYNWTIQQRHFPTFTPVLDFTHVIERVYETARAVREDSNQAWRIYIRWTRWCWEGKGIEMLEEMRQEQRRLGDPPKDCEDHDPRKVLAENVTYFQNNASRMRYPRYRKEGLPMTSAHMESLVKEINYRVKGTEKFWNDGPAGEAILQIRAAALSEDNRLKKHLLSRPGNPYHPNVKVQPRPATAA